jgi:glycosyltransferase involved in cell wall biosynthesis
MAQARRLLAATAAAAALVVGAASACERALRFESPSVGDIFAFGDVPVRLRINDCSDAPLRLCLLIDRDTDLWEDGGDGGDYFCLNDDAPKRAFVLESLGVGTHMIDASLQAHGSAEVLAHDVVTFDIVPRPGGDFFDPDPAASRVLRAVRGGAADQVVPRHAWGQAPSPAERASAERASAREIRNSRSPRRPGLVAREVGPRGGVARAAGLLAVPPRLGPPPWTGRAGAGGSVRSHASPGSARGGLNRALRVALVSLSASLGGQEILYANQARTVGASARGTARLGPGPGPDLDPPYDPPYEIVYVTAPRPDAGLRAALREAGVLWEQAAVAADAWADPLTWERAWPALSALRARCLERTAPTRDGASPASRARASASAKSDGEGPKPGDPAAPCWPDAPAAASAAGLALEHWTALRSFARQLGRYDVVNVPFFAAYPLDATVLLLARLVGVKARVLELPNVQFLDDGSAADATAVVTPSPFAAAHAQVERFVLPALARAAADLRSSRNSKFADGAGVPAPVDVGSVDVGSAQLHVIAPAIVATPESPRLARPWPRARAGAPGSGRISVRVGTVARLSCERSPGMFLHAAARLRATLEHEPERVAWPAWLADPPLGVERDARDARVYAREIRNSGATARFTLAGGGGLEEGVSQLARALGLGRDALALPGRLEHAAVQTLVASFDVYVNPRFGETFGLAVVEAQSLGVPVVACAAGNMPGLIEHLVTGVLAPCSLPEGGAREDLGAAADQLALGVLWLLRHPEATRIIVRNAQRSARRRFSEARFAGDYDRLYRQQYTAWIAGD